jgi:hypothetical protein
MSNQRRSLNVSSPAVFWNHNCGPDILFQDGSMHWLTFFERMAMQLGIVSADELISKYSMK